jgi:two-component system, chemotaxis family, chemotaxis protein CheY
MPTILLVDDSSTIRNMLKAYLLPLGYTVIEAPGGRAGLEKARTDHLDLIITDQNMPGMDGLGMVKAIREGGEKNAHVPIVVLTTETSDDMKAKFRAAGANGWMSKPFSPERLDAALKRFLG